jgi:hypothetical protein
MRQTGTNMTVERLLRATRVHLLVMLWCVSGGGLVPGLAQAQTARPEPSPTAAARVDLAELRHQVYVMEGALVRAVEFGAQKLNREIRAVVPDLFLLSGSAQAHGVYLDGYGIFFDVSVPMLRQSMAWGLRMMLQQDEAATRQDLAALRELVQRETDPRTRQSLDAALARLEAQASPFTGGGVAALPPSGALPTGMTTAPPSAGVAAAWPSSLASAAAGQAGRPGTDPARVLDAGRLYTESVQQALIDAMLDFSGPMNLAPGEWLTVAARDNAERDALAPQDPYESSVTVVLRISGADLREYRSGVIDKAMARTRVRRGEF